MVGVKRSRVRVIKLGFVSALAEVMMEQTMRKHLILGGRYLSS